MNDKKTEFQKLHLLDAQGLENVMQPGEFSLQTFKHRIIYLYLATNSWPKHNFSLENREKLKQYHQVMTDQVSTGILEPVLDKPSENQVHYTSHHAILK